MGNIVPEDGKWDTEIQMYIGCIPKTKESICGQQEKKAQDANDKSKVSTSN